MRTKRKPDRSSSGGTATAEEKRRYPRTREFGSPELQVLRTSNDGEPQEIRAVLWDFSEGGLGLDTGLPLDTGEQISVSGDLHGPDYSMSIEAQARVAYCRLIDEALYRVGVAFLDVKYRRVQPEKS